MSNQHHIQKNYAFIDSQNLNLAIQELGWKLDFQRFFIYLRSKYQVEKAFLFLGYLPENESLYKHLRSIGYKIIFKPVVKNNRQQVKGNVDAELVLHSVKIEYDNYNKAIIVSNDGDFYCLIEHLLENNKLLKLITPSKKYSSLLRRFAPFIVPVPLFQHKVEQKKRGIPSV